MVFSYIFSKVEHYKEKVGRQEDNRATKIPNRQQ